MVSNFLTESLFLNLFNKFSKTCTYALSKQTVSDQTATLRSVCRAFSSNFWKRPLAKIGEKMIDLTSKLGEINDIEHNKGSKIYPQNQVFLDCIMPSIWLKYHTDMGHCFS